MEVSDAREKEPNSKLQKKKKRKEITLGGRERSEGAKNENNIFK